VRKLGSFIKPKAQREAEAEAESFSMNMGRPTADAVEKLNAFSIGTPHADTGVREIREIINGGKAFAVLTPISLLPHIPRRTNEREMDEGIAEKVNRMTKTSIMSATADAWLIHIPGMARRHEVFTAELLAMDRSNVEDLVAIMQDSTEDNDASRACWPFHRMAILDKSQSMNRRDSSRARMRKFTIRDTPKCIMFSTLFITGQASMQR
jgi:hypothetical protein